MDPAVESETEAPAPVASIQARIGELRERFESLSPTARLGAFLAVGAAVGIAVWLYARSGQSPMTVLFTGLSPDDSARIVERLSRSGTPFETEGTETVLVPEDKVHEARLTLAAEGLPSDTGVGFEVFDEQRFGESEFSEQVQYHRALEGELSRTISHLAGVERARVHLVLPQRSLFVQRDSRASASVVLHLRPGWRVRDEQVAGIVHLVASSVRGLDPDNVTVVDGEGRDLGQGAAGEDGVGDALAYRQRIEELKEEAVQELLDATFGPGVTRVRVSADVSFRREERTEERYLPDEVAARSFQIQEERDTNGNANAEGVPGAASNLPGGEAPEAGTDDRNMTRRSETRNFEISKTVRHAVEPVGRIEKLQVAVVVDGTWEGETFTPRTEEELERIESIVSTAAGLDEERGDRIVVSSVPFTRVEEAEAAPVDPLQQYLQYWPYAAGALGVLLLIVIVLMRRRRKKKKEAEEQARLEALARGEAIEGPDGEVLQLSEVAGERAAEDIRRLLESGGELEADAAEIQLIAAELAAEDPERAARVLRSWIREEMSEEEAAA